MFVNVVFFLVIDSFLVKVEIIDEMGIFCLFNIEVG